MKNAGTHEKFADEILSALGQMSSDNPIRRAMMEEMYRQRATASELRTLANRPI